MITIDDIRKLNPCYDPTRYLPEGWSGTLVDILNVADCPAEDRIWVVTRLLSEKDARLFACWCVRQVWHLLHDERSKQAVEVAERYANGWATQEELAAASSAAWAAASSAAWAAASSAASSAARAAAWAAARDAARAAAKDAARAAAWDAAWDAQINRLIEVCKELEQ